MGLHIPREIDFGDTAESPEGGKLPHELIIVRDAPEASCVQGARRIDAHMCNALLVTRGSGGTKILTYCYLEKFAFRMCTFSPHVAHSACKQPKEAELIDLPPIPVAPCVARDGARVPIPLVKSKYGRKKRNAPPYSKGCTICVAFETRYFPSRRAQRCV